MSFFMPPHRFAAIVRAATNKYSSAYADGAAFPKATFASFSGFVFVS